MHAVVTTSVPKVSGAADFDTLNTVMTYASTQHALDWFGVNRTDVDWFDWFNTPDPSSSDPYFDTTRIFGCPSIGCSAPPRAGS